MIIDGPMKKKIEQKFKKGDPVRCLLLEETNSLKRRTLLCMLLDLTRKHYEAVGEERFDDATAYLFQIQDIEKGILKDHHARSGKGSADGGFKGGAKKHEAALPRHDEYRKWFIACKLRNPSHDYSTVVMLCSEHFKRAKKTIDRATKDLRF